MILEISMYFKASQCVNGNNECSSTNTGDAKKGQKFTWGKKLVLVSGLSFVTCGLLGDHLTFLNLFSHL